MDQTKTIKNKETTGLNQKKTTLAIFGVPSSFKINLKPSLIGCNNPKYLTFLGPFRDCI